MVNHNGFLVQYDRFSLTDPTRYILKGYLADETEVSAVFGDKAMPVELEKLTDNTDERYGGFEVRAVLVFDGDIPANRTL